MAKAKTRIQLEQLRLLKEAGYDIPDPLLELVETQDQKRRGVVQLWRCPCGDYESEILIKAIDCPKNHHRELVWQEEQ